MYRTVVGFTFAGLVALNVLAFAAQCFGADEPTDASAAPNKAVAQGSVVVTYSTHLMVGHDKVASVAAGQRLNVIDSKDGWVGTYVENNGKKTYGWLREECIDRGATTVAPQGSRRSFSFEPSDAASTAAALPVESFYSPRTYSGRSSSYSQGRSSGRTSTSTPLYMLPKGNSRKSGGR